jgi:hypothetical protein
MSNFITVQDQKYKGVDLGTICFDADLYRGIVQDAAGEGLFVARQLEYIKAKTYDVKYGELKHRLVFPVSNEGGPGMRFITFRTYDQIGAAKLISAYAQDLPRADIAVKETTIGVREYGASFGYNAAELRAAAAAQGSAVPLDAKRAEAARKAIEIALNTVAWKGDAKAGLIGLFSHPNIPITVAPNGASPVAPAWSGKTSAEILKDMNAVCNDIPVTTKLVEAPNRLLMTLKAYQQATTTIMTGGFNRSVMEQFLATNAYINSMSQIIVCNELVGIGPGSTDAMVAYNYSSDKLSLEIPMEMIFHPEQRRNFEIVIPCEASTGGLLVYYPLSLNIIYGI